jgi:hypothetical protein
VGVRVRLFPARPGRPRRVVVGAIALSLLLHAFGGGLFAWMARLLPTEPPPHDDEAVAVSVTIERARPTPTASPTPEPSATPVPTPTPLPKASAAPAIPRLATAPRPPQRRSVAVAHVAPHELARTRPDASPQPRRAAPAQGAYTPSQLAALEGQFRNTIAAAQRAVAEGPPQTGSAGRGPASTTKRYDATAIGSPADEFGGGGVCDNLAEETRAERTYVYWRCRVRYSDGYREIVAFPWPFVYPRGHVPRGRETFPGQPPPDGFQLPQVFALSRQVCYYFRSRCDTVLERERASGAPDYGTPP